MLDDIVENENDLNVNISKTDVNDSFVNETLKMDVNDSLKTVIDNEPIDEEIRLTPKPRSTPIMRRHQGHRHDFLAKPLTVKKDIEQSFKPIDESPSKSPIKILEEVQKQNDNPILDIKGDKKEKVKKINEPCSFLDETKEEVKEKKVKLDKNELKTELTTKELIKETKPKKKKYKIPDYNAMTDEEKSRCRMRFKSRFFLLRDTWGNTIPEINDSMTLYELHELYESYVRSIHIKDSSGKYKVYLVIMWLVIEFVCIKIGLDVGGYAMSQFKSMNKYERMLIELGEKNYSYGMEGSNDWPVEFNILFMALINAITFIVIKWLSHHVNAETAENLVTMFTNMFSGETLQPGQVLFGGKPHEQAEYDGLTETPRRQQGQDPINMILNLGNAFLSQQQKSVNNQPTKPQSFKPVYDD